MIGQLLMRVCLQRRTTRVGWSCYVSWKYLLNFYLFWIREMKVVMECVARGVNGMSWAKYEPVGWGRLQWTFRRTESAAADSKARILNTVVVYPLWQPLLVGESDLPVCGPPTSFSVHLASSVILRWGMSNNPGWQRGAYMGEVEEMCVVYVGVTNAFYILLFYIEGNGVTEGV